MGYFIDLSGIQEGDDNDQDGDLVELEFNLDNTISLKHFCQPCPTITSRSLGTKQKSRRKVKQCYFL